MKDDLIQQAIDTLEPLKADKQASHAIALLNFALLSDELDGCSACLAHSYRAAFGGKSSSYCPAHREQLERLGIKA